MEAKLLPLIPLLPLVGFLINGIWYAFFQIKPGAKTAGSRVTGAIATSAIAASFVISLVLFLKLTGLPASERFFDSVVFSWMKVGELDVDFAFRIDALSSIFCLVITGVGSLIHLYSIGYMSHDEAPGKYFAYLNLFCFAMLVLVLGSSLPVLFLGWEGVGLCSYLLIGFWYTDDEKASAGKKAFVVNRIGDLGFLLGMFMIFTLFGTVDFQELRGVMSEPNAVSGAMITAICLLLFVGCTGKSAQIPLYVWLPDAMAGPTPVSALIHAATMVTSGVYLIARLNFMFIQSPTALGVIAVVGAATALFAASMAITQKDIKKVLAYSTVSQLGYMFLACGVGAFSAGVFHVMTHAFFKALLFLGAGSVIYAMHHEQDMLKMGALRSKMPRTFAAMACGWAAICGAPLLSGFWSKDEVLWKSLSSTLGNPFLYSIGFITAALTAFYMTRLFYLTFFGEARYKDDPAHPVHESPPEMTIPLIVLAVLSVLGGFVGMPFPSLNFFHHWLEPIVTQAETQPQFTHAIEYALMAVSGIMALGVMYLGFKFYSDMGRAINLKRKWNWAYNLLFNKYYIDEIYESVFVKPIIRFSNVLWKNFDVAVIDRIILGFGKVSSWTGQTMRVIQTGAIQVYAVMLLIGLVLSLGWMLYGLV